MVKMTDKLLVLVGGMLGTLSRTAGFHSPDSLFFRYKLRRLKSILIAAEAASVAPKPSPFTQVMVRGRRVLVKRDDLFRLPDSVNLNHFLKTSFKHRNTNAQLVCCFLFNRRSTLPFPRGRQGFMRE